MTDFSSSTSPPNLSGKPRRGIAFQYRADDAYQLADHVFDDTGLLVHGRHRERVRCESAIYRLPRVPGREHQNFGDVWNQVGDFAITINRERFK